MKGRIMFPIHAVSGKVIGFGGRVLKTDNKEIAKYLNSPESEIYHKSHTLYGIYFGKNAIVKHDKCFLVEGYMDVIAMFQAGIENVVASSGTSLTIDQIRLVRRFTKNVTIIYDGDPAGIKAAFRGIPMVLEEGLNVRVLLLPDGHDPDSFSKAYSAQALNDYIAQNEHDFITFTADLLLKESNNDPAKRATVISDIIKTISVIPDQIYRQVFIKELSQLFGVDESVIYNQINILRKEKSTNSRQYESSAAIAMPEPIVSNSETDQRQGLAYPYSGLERNLLRILILYASEPIVDHPYTDTMEGPMTVVDLFHKEIIEGQMFFVNETYKRIFDDFFEQYNKGNLPTEQYYFNHIDRLFQQFAIDNLHEKYKLSKIFLLDKTVDTENIDFSKEEELRILDRLVIESITNYKLDRIKLISAELNESIKTATTAEELSSIIEKLNIYNSIKKELSEITHRL